MTKYILSLLVAATVVAQESTLEKFDALVIPIHQKSDELYVNIPEKTFGSDKNPSIYLNDMLFVKAIAELHGKKIHQLRVRKSQITDSGLDALAQFPTIKKLELSNSKITDEGIKKIVMYCPRLERLNIWGCVGVTDESLVYLRDLWTLEKLHLFGTKVTWDGANKYRGIMQAMAANENLAVHVGNQYPTLYAFKDEELWKRTYQKNVEIGIIDEAEVLKKHGQLTPTKTDYNNQYEEDLKKQATEPILNGE